MELSDITVKELLVMLIISFGVSILFWYMVIEFVGTNDGPYNKEVQYILRERCTIRNMTLVEWKLVNVSDKTFDMKLICQTPENQMFLYLVRVGQKSICKKIDKWQECIEHQVIYTHEQTQLLN